MATGLRELRESRSPVGSWHRVRSISSKGAEKYLRLEGGNKLTVHRFACAGVGDLVRLDSDGRLWVKTYDGQAPVTPAFVQKTRIEVVPGRFLPLSIQEVVALPQLEAYQALSQ